tara:strand:- start:461 stop:592 length:132 start_codon:yes stop_codon:yes gene_type:complete
LGGLLEGIGEERKESAVITRDEENNIYALPLSFHLREKKGVPN